MLRNVLLTLLGILVFIQFFRPEKNQAEGLSPNDITTKYAVPANVQGVLKRSCFDCHSNNTTYPWYDNIQPVAWFLANHIKEGKSELNFSEFATYPPKKARHKLEEVGEAVTDGWMPLGSYLWIHQDAKLKPEEAKLIASWASGLREQIQVPAGEEEEHHHEEP
ncbi:heme-binding domain-containing protein [Spirosoma validum]|uniref:Heme-binding domain-containing protein n=1 Tax=Spirosoma validum TaxID=2771355 RepID=A0A927AY92_9BACT|nr:heme-binding domain-containing protein [Spirosoma validum]MBD2752061.1 heme-binding domain-containing protein [Spirosoma validum]